MKNLLRCCSKNLLFYATVISIISGAFTVTMSGLEDVYKFGFPGTFITLYKRSSGSLFSISINPLQFIGNIVVIWLILFYLSKVFSKIVLIRRKKKVHKATKEFPDRIQ